MKIVEKFEIFVLKLKESVVPPVSKEVGRGLLILDVERTDIVFNAIPKAISKALKCFRAAAEKDDSNAMLCLAQFYLKGVGVRKSHKKAASLLERGSDLGNPRCSYELSNMYAIGRGTVKDDEASLRELEKAAQVLLEAKYVLARRLIYRDDSGREVNRGLECLLECALLNDNDAFNDLCAITAARAVKTASGEIPLTEDEFRYLGEVWLRLWAAFDTGLNGRKNNDLARRCQFMSAMTGIADAQNITKAIDEIAAARSIFQMMDDIREKIVDTGTDNIKDKTVSVKLDCCCNAMLSIFRMLDMADKRLDALEAKICDGSYRKEDGRKYFKFCQQTADFSKKVYMWRISFIEGGIRIMEDMHDDDRKPAESLLDLALAAAGG